MGRVIVFVHGACSHSPGFSDPWWAALKPYTIAFGDGELGVTRFEVVWSDLINSGGPAPILGCLQDFYAYLFNDAIRHEVIQRFGSVVLPLIQARHQLDIIAHSEGSMLTYEGLWALPQDDSKCGLTFPISNFFTPGSVLSMNVAQDNLLTEGRIGSRPPSVKKWWNLWASGDWFGGPLQGRFGVTQDFTGLDPVGCGSGILDGLCCHNSYFNPQNTAVFRDIFAAKINAS